jgi:hypothetical protein
MMLSKVRPSGVQHCVVQRQPDILDEHTASIFRAEE